MPAGYGRMLLDTKSDLDYGLWTEPQVHADGLRKAWPRGMSSG